MSPEGLHLPDAVVRHIASYAAKGNTPSDVLVTLVSLCGVSRQWRSIARDVEPGLCLGYGASENSFSTLPVSQTFKKLTPTQKEVIFRGAARLLTGYTELAFCGDGVTDAVVIDVAKNSHGKLLKCKFKGCNTVTDAAIQHLLSACPRLQELVLEDISVTVTGKFLPVIFKLCPQLQTLALVNVPGLAWNTVQPSHWAGNALTRLQVLSCSLGLEFDQLLTVCPQLSQVILDGPPNSVKMVAAHCPQLSHFNYAVSHRSSLDEALDDFASMPRLRVLEIVVRSFVVSKSQMVRLGALSVSELHVDSYLHKQQPNWARAQFSHVDNEGVRALVDMVCDKSKRNFDPTPLALSLCGAASLGHEAVSALLRLPILTDLDISGCCKITAIDKMRLIAKVKAGRELVDARRRLTSKRSCRT